MVINVYFFIPVFQVLVKHSDSTVDHKLDLDKMIRYSNMTWAEIKAQTHDDGKSKHHVLDFDGISKDAKKRIEKMKLEEYSDSIFSFALTNLVRLIGIRKDEKFEVLWYDPLHDVYPSPKKHT